MIFSGSLRFLVVDDDADVRDALVEMVERLGHQADTAADGVEAMEALAVERYDVMLLDLKMPRMPGEDVMRWLKAHPQWGQGLRVVVVTGLAKEHRRRLEELGAHAVVPKPLQPQHLRDLVAGTPVRGEGQRRTSA